MILDRCNTFYHSPLLNQISSHYLGDERTIVRDLAIKAALTSDDKKAIQKIAGKLLIVVRQTRLNKSGLDAFMAKYDLSSEQGIVLMCLAEALLRVPDRATADKLIQDKLTSTNWQAHVGDSEYLFVNAATWCLMLTGKILHTSQNSNRFQSTLKDFLNKRSRPVIRRTIMYAMTILGQQYVMAEAIEKALKRACIKEKQGFTYSYDMLGEAAITMADARYYYSAYYVAIQCIGEAANKGDVRKNPGISVKLSALHPRYEIAQSDRVHAEMYPKLLKLVELAKDCQIGLNIDAEETERLALSLTLIERLAKAPTLAGFEGIGIVVQAYQKRAIFVLDYLIDLAKRTKQRFMVRLVKGAYWDQEIKQAQVEGFEGYPVFTQKCYTDVCYQACVRRLLENTAYIYPQFATHNAYTTAMIIHLAGDYKDYEFQCLHGMGDALYDHVVGKEKFNIPCRIYAPVGTYKHLLPYLVRRLLENGANSSFVHRIIDEKTPIENLIEDPVEKAKAMSFKPHDMIPLPGDIFGGKRMNAKSYNLHDTEVLEALAREMTELEKSQYIAKPIVFGCNNIDPLPAQEIQNPADGKVFGHVHYANQAIVAKAMENAFSAFEQWNLADPNLRITALEKCADLLEKNMPKFMAIAIQEAGKTLANALSELREAIDFCRYYAGQAREEFTAPKRLTGPTGERNEISLHGRGVVVCISPWNFPLAIFLGQVTAALAAGNTVVAKPAEQTSIIAYEAVKLLHDAGIPENVLQFIPGAGDIGAALVGHKNVAGVVFTGSTEVAKSIQQTLAQKPGPIIPLIAETGGQNVMVVDSSALPEQVVTDVIASAFDSAGQRCSALRVLYLQQEIADTIIPMLTGAMAELNVGDPGSIKTDVGPVIDKAAQKRLDHHVAKMKKQAKLIYEIPQNNTLNNGNYVYPIVFEIKSIHDLSAEVFGPILHIVRFKAKNLEKLVREINATGYGLTFGIHSRIEKTITFFRENIRVGNIYVNRNMVGAVVGVQPFGGQGLSGTGPKAGGPFYLHRLATERTVSVDTTASGGNAALMHLEQ